VLDSSAGPERRGVAATPRLRCSQRERAQRV